VASSPWLGSALHSLGGVSEGRSGIVWLVGVIDAMRSSSSVDVVGGENGWAGGAMDAGGAQREGGREAVKMEWKKGSGGLTSLLG
jgi:hypothetical protein